MEKEYLFENIRTIYQENGMMSRTGLEWRYKIMTRYYISIGSLLIFTWYIYTSNHDKLIWIPVFLASVISFVSYMLDILTAKYLKITLDTGSCLEKKLIEGEDGLLTFYQQSSEFYEVGNTNIAKLFRCFYLLSSIALLIITGLFIFI